MEQNDSKKKVDLKEALLRQNIATAKKYRRQGKRYSEIASLMGVKESVVFMWLKR